MKFLTVLKVILLGIIEGITEWLPVSSTGHMKLFNNFWAITGVSPGFTEMFEYVIQLAAILAVIILFWKTIFPLGKEKSAETDGVSSEKMKIVWKKDVLHLWGRCLWRVSLPHLR